MQFFIRSTTPSASSSAVISSDHARLPSHTGWAECGCCSWAEGVGKSPLQVNQQLEGWEDKKRSGREINWNGNLEEETLGKHYFLSFHKSKVGRDMPFPSAHHSQKLTRITRNKSKPGHSDARPPQVTIPVLAIWKINTQNTWKARLQHCALLNNNPRWKVIKLEYLWLPYNISQQSWASLNWRFPPCIYGSLRNDNKMETQTLQGGSTIAS